MKYSEGLPGVRDGSDGGTREMDVEILVVIVTLVMDIEICTCYRDA